MDEHRSRRMAWGGLALLAPAAAFIGAAAGPALLERGTARSRR